MYANPSGWRSSSIVLIHGTGWRSMPHVTSHMRRAHVQTTAGAAKASTFVWGQFRSQLVHGCLHQCGSCSREMEMLTMRCRVSSAQLRGMHRCRGRRTVSDHRTQGTLTQRHKAAHAVCRSSILSLAYTLSLSSHLCARESPLPLLPRVPSDAAPTHLSQMELDSGVVTRGHRRLRSSAVEVEAPAPKRARPTKGTDEGDNMAMDLQNGHANGAPAPPSRLGSKQLIDRHACHRLRCCALSAARCRGRQSACKPQGRSWQYL